MAMPDYTELMEFRAFGKQLTQTPVPTNLSGTYHSEAYGDFHLQQDGAALSGCYEHDGGLVQGGAEAHLMRLTWHADQRPRPRRHGAQARRQELRGLVGQ